MKLHRPLTVLLALLAADLLVAPSAQAATRPALQSPQGSQGDRSGRSRRSVPQKRSSGRGEERDSGPNSQQAQAVLRALLPPTAPGKGEGERGGDGTERDPKGRSREKRALEFVDEAQLRAWYETADFNANGWISFSESSVSFGFDRPRYGSFDADRDGRLALEEFAAYYRYSIVHQNGFREPRPAPESQRARQRTPEQLRNAYDMDLDGKLSRVELQRVLEDYDRADLEAEHIATGMDRDGDSRLSVAELVGLPPILFPVEVPATADAAPTHKTLEELFGQVVPRPGGAGNYPPQIVGPVSHFRRLDLDADGKISRRDLEDLLRPVHTTIRVQTVLHTLDVDGDGVLSRAELVAALVPPRDK